MTTSQAVRTAWEETIWRAPEMAAITPTSFLHPVVVDSESDLQELKHDSGTGPVVNYFQCLVRRTADLNEQRSKEQRFDIEVTHVVQQTGVADSTFNPVQDGVEAMDDLVFFALGITWGGTVDYYRQAEGFYPDRVVVGDLACWRGGYRYTAFKRTDF